MKLHTYTPEILDIWKAHRPCSVNDAVDMFINNIHDAGRPEDQYFNHGADHIDYAALQKDFPAQGAQETVELKNRFLADYEANELAILRLREQGDNEAIRDLMEAAAEA